MHSIDALWIPILGILMPIVLVPMIMILKHRTLQREWQHKERMRAIELGVPVPKAHSGGSVAAIGAGVPIAAVLGAVATTLSYESPSGDEVPMLGIVWGCAVLISAVGMITSLILAHIGGRTPRQSESFDPARNGKAAFDPDAFDVVSSRA
jgi:hypothetical protein